MKNPIAISALALATVLPATAVQAEEWSGFYAGASGGYSFSSVETGAVENNSKKDPTYDGIAAAFGEADPTGFEGAVFAGYRMQSGGLVYGVEAGVGFSGAEGSATQGSSTETSTVSFEESYYLRGTLGTEFQGALIYGALGIVSTAVMTEDTDFNERHEGTLTGLVLGMGYERMLDANWGLRAEINHTIYENGYDIILHSIGGTYAPATIQNTSVQIGVTYHF